MPIESLESVFWVTLPLLAVVVVFFLFNSAARDRATTARRDDDHRHNSDYLTWREWVRAQGGLKPLFRTRFLGVQDPCFALENNVSLYEPCAPCLQCGSVGEPLFDTPRGMPVGEGWSLLHSFGGARLVGRGTLCVTSREVLFRGVGANVSVPVQKVHTVAAACSNLLLGAGSDSFLFAGVNGQKLRDIMSFLLEG